VEVVSLKFWFILFGGVSAPAIGALKNLTIF
jgi:hypothetical protein